METRGPSIVFKTHKCLLARDTRLLADGIVAPPHYQKWRSFLTAQLQSFERSVREFYSYLCVFQAKQIPYF